MAINPLELVGLARDRLTELPESVIFSRENLLGLIPSAISMWQEQTNKDSAKRHNFIQESDSIVVKQGVADITDAVDDYGYRLEFIEDSDIIFEQNANLTKFKVKFVDYDRLKAGGRQDKFFVLAHMKGQQITFRNPLTQSGDATKTLNARFKLRAVVMPNDLSEIPESVAPDLAMFLAEIAKGQFRQQNKAIDLSPK